MLGRKISPVAVREQKTPIHFGSIRVAASI
jgi:hypothetical protein